MIQSAGILLFRRTRRSLEVFLVHPGGPFWKNKDDGAWTIPKGEHDASEDPLLAAQREFAEETGSTLDGDFIALGSVKQGRNKTITAWAMEGDFNPSDLRSNVFQLEWPPRSGKLQDFLELDRGAWFMLKDAETKLLPAQQPFLLRLALYISNDGDRLQ
jgi:predicted NUDIX family NTP pyrophosphohydrolase